MEANNPKKEDPMILNWWLPVVYFFMSQFMTKNFFDSSFQIYIHIFMKDSVTQGDLTVIEEFDILHLSRNIFQVFHSSLSRRLLKYHRTTLLFSSLAE